MDIIPWVSGGLAGGLVNVGYHVFRSIQEHRRRPKLQILAYKHKKPFHRLTRENPSGATAYYVNVGVANRGYRTAHRCQPVVTARGEKTSDGWKREENWVPLGLRWALDEPDTLPSGFPRADRDLIPEPPSKTKKHVGAPARYMFNLVKISNADLGMFRLLVTLEPNAQPCRFQAGEYCFQVTLYCEDGEWSEAWYRVEYTGNFTPASLRVEQLEEPPWI